MKKLTPFQRRFVQKYHSQKKPNKREAYEAVYKARGETARVEAERTLRLPHVKAYLESLQKKTEDRAVKKADDIIRELENIGFSNIRDFIDIEAGKITVKNLAELSASKLSAVSEITRTDTQYGGTTKFKLHDKLTALKLIGLRFGIFPTKIEHTGEVTLAQAVHKAMKEDKNK